MNKLLKVSIVMSVYNGEKYLRQAIDSILNQTFTDFEFIIVDDGSTDKTAERLRSYDDDRIVLIDNGGNIGLTKSLNKGMKIAKGKYIARMDADDVCLPERLAKQVQFLDEHPDIGVLGTGFETIDDVGTRGVKVQFSTEPGLIRWQMFFCCCVAHPSVMVRRTVYERLGGYNPKVHQSQDYELWLRAVRETKIANLQDVLLQLRKHSGNLTIVEAHYFLQDMLAADRLAISVALGRQVSLDRVRSLWDPLSITKARDMLDTATLIYQLYLVCARYVSASERRQIREDAALRLNSLATACVRINLPISIILWGWAVRLSPELSPRIITSTAMRMTRYLTGHVGLRKA